MRGTLTGLMILATSAAVLMSTPSAGGAAVYKPVADPYKWCAVFSGSMAGGPNCGFLTWDQCMATVRGMGGFCRESMWYTGPDKPVRHVRKRRYQ